MTTSEKLTARLPDGQEVDLVPEASCDKGQMYLLRPLNYKPSPPKEVFVVTNESGVLATYLSDVSDEYKGTSAIVRRYILAQEPEKEPECMTCGKEMERLGGSNRNYFCRYCVEPKPAREWWEVRTGTTFSSVYSAQHTYERAILAASLFDRGEYKIVHVREVVSNNKENV